MRGRSNLNGSLTAANLPVRVSNLSSIWMVHYTEPSRYNWMLQYYLRAEGLALSWVGTGRLIFSLNYTDADFDTVAERFVTAARKMKDDGWWWQRCHPDQQEHPPPDPEGDADKKAAAVDRSRLSVAYSLHYACLTCFSRPGSISSPFSRASGALR